MHSFPHFKRQWEASQTNSKKSNSSNNKIGNNLPVWFPEKKFQMPCPPPFTCPCPSLLYTLPLDQRPICCLHFRVTFFYSPSSSLLDFLEFLYLAWGSFYLYLQSFLPGCCSQISIHLENCLELEFIWLWHISVQIGGLILFSPSISLFLQEIFSSLNVLYILSLWSSGQG